MRSSRLLAILIHLEAVRTTTTAELAALTEVSQRTAHRDVAALQAAGVPLWTEVGPNGGVRLLDGWQSGIDRMNASEAGILVLSAIPGVAADLGLDAMLASAELKLLAGLSADGRGRANEIRDRFHLDVPGWFHAKEGVPWLGEIGQAVWTQRRVDIVYGQTHKVRRRIDPLGLVLKAGTWYVVARHRSAVRTYRVGRVVRATMRDESFERPPRFDLAVWWRASSSDFDRAILRASVTLRLSPRGCRALPGVLLSEAVPDALAAASAPDAQGWVVVDVPVESEAIAQHQLLALGAEVEVLAPKSVRLAVAATAAAMVALNS